MIKLISEFGRGCEAQSLLLELPESLVEDIEIAADGTVDVHSLIKVLSKYDEQQSDELSVAERINIYDAIFNSSRTVAQRDKLS